MKSRQFLSLLLALVLALSFALPASAAEEPGDGALTRGEFIAAL